jgi:acyl-CoA synthetase (NDP forming)
MLSELRAVKVLDGYRGSPAADRVALEETIQRVSALVESVPELLEMDINPLRLFVPGKGAMVLDARIRLG